MCPSSSCQAEKITYSSINTIEKIMSVQHFAKRLPYLSPISTSPSRETPDPSKESTISGDVVK